MKNTSMLSTLYRDYKSGRIGRKVLEAKLMGEIAGLAPSMIRHGRKKDLSDFLAWLYPRIVNAISNYRDNGSSFDAYIASSVHSAYKEYQSGIHVRRMTERTVWSLKEHEKLEENEALFLAENDDEEQPPFRHVQNPRQILILLLKSYYFLSDDFISRIAPALGMDKENINMLIMELRELRAEREQEIHDFRERVYAQFYRCLSFQRNASSAPANSAMEERYNHYLQRGIKRLNSMRETLRTLHADASNKEIAKVLGVSKGTVDASLYNVRKCYPGALPEPDSSDIPEPCYPDTPPEQVGSEALSGRSDSAPSM